MEMGFHLVSGIAKSVAMASGKTLDERIMSELDEMAGVRETSVVRTGDAVRVTVILDDMDFSRFDAVVQKELELYSRYPDLSFYFDIVSAAELEEELESRSLNAARG
jgi:hypothetical protein